MIVLSACKQVDFKIDFVVDGEIYDSISTSGRESIKLPDDPKKEGFVFDGWYWDNETWKKAFTANSLLEAPLSGNMSVYAKWRAENAVAGDLISISSFESQGNGTYYLKVANNTSSVLFDRYVSVADGCSWVVATDIACNKTIASKASNLKVGDNTFYILLTEANETTHLFTLRIRRAAVYTVKFDTEGLTSIPSQAVEEGGYAEAPAGISLSKTGYDFVGWSYDFTKPVTKNETVTASWRAWEYTVSFDANTGKGAAMASVTFKYGELNTLPQNTFTKDDCTFIGWNTAADGSGNFYADAAVAKNLCDVNGGTVTLYAQFKSNNEKEYSWFYNGTHITMMNALIYGATPFNGNTDPALGAYYTGNYNKRITVHDTYASGSKNLGLYQCINARLGGQEMSLTSIYNADGATSFRLTMDIAAVAGKNIMPFALTADTAGVWNNSSPVNPVIFITGNDRYVYLGVQDKAHRIAELKDGVFSSVIVDIDYSEVFAGKSSKVTYIATNLDGEKIAVSLYNSLGVTHSRGSYFYMYIGTQLADDTGLGFKMKTNSALTFGEYTLRSVILPEHKVVDGNGDLVMYYEIFKEYALPESYNGRLVEWYSDSDLTQKITSIGTGNYGTVTVYAKYLPGESKIIYKVDGVTEKELLYDNTADTYHSYAPAEKSGFTFAGWYADSNFTTKASPVIPAGTSDVVIVYAKFVRTELTKDSWAIHEALINKYSGLDGFSYNDKRNTEGYVEYTFANGMPIESYADIPYYSTKAGDYWGAGAHFSDKLMADGYFSGSGKYLYKTSLQIGKGSTGSLLNVLVNGHGGNAIYLMTNKATDSLGIQTGTSVVLEGVDFIEMNETGLTDVDVLIDWSGCGDLTVRGVYHRGDVIVNTANGPLVIKSQIPLDASAGNAGRFFLYMTEGACSVRIGEFSIGIGTTHTVVDPNGNIIMTYEMFEAADLPTTYNGSDVEWYSDAALTNKITGISKGNSGVVTVYPKY